MSRKHKPKLGQNFLSDLGARQRIVDALGDLSHATVLEIGPGHGALTDLLLPRARRLIAVELDHTLAIALQARLGARPNLSIVEADILTVDLPALLHDATETSNTTDAGPIHVIGNLPYYITSDILLKLFRSSLAAPGLLRSAVLMMQREVAERVAAAPGRRDFGLLSATAQMHASAELLFTLGPGSFSPPPEVDSTVLRLRFAPRFAALGVQPAAFDRFLHACFAQKRKTLARNLRETGITPEQIARAWPPELDPQIRAEATSLEQLAAIHLRLASDPKHTPALTPKPRLRPDDPS